MSTKLNFSIQFSPFNSVTSEYLYPNLYHEVVLQTTGYHGLQIYKTNVFLSSLFLSTSRGFLIPPGEPYTPFEKLFLPFDSDTWFWLTVFIMGGIVVICVTKLAPRSVQNFVFGRRVQTPILNLFQTVFGLGQMVLPGRNFARYILTMFILLCLVMRTAYQGKMFEFIQKEMRKPVVQTIREMIDDNFTIYHPLGYREVFAQFEILNG